MGVKFLVGSLTIFDQMARESFVFLRRGKNKIIHICTIEANDTMSIYLTALV